MPILAPGAASGTRRREALLKNLLKAVIVFSALMAILTGTQLKTQLNTAQEEIIAAFVALIFFGRWQSQKRSRYIPKSVRRAVIARDLKGEEFDPQKHHIDHVWPFSRGGSHTVDNLRVVTREKNMEKAAKRPRMREMW